MGIICLYQFDRKEVNSDIVFRSVKSGSMFQDVIKSMCRGWNDEYSSVMTVTALLFHCSEKEQFYSWGDTRALSAQPRAGVPGCKWFSKNYFDNNPQGDNSISKCKFQQHTEGPLLLPGPQWEMRFSAKWDCLWHCCCSCKGFFNVKRSCFYWERICSCKVESLCLLCMSSRKTETM